MFTIWADDLCIFDDTSPNKSLQLVAPKANLSAGVVGTLDITIPPGNVGYDSVQRLTTTLKVERNGEIIWMGRAFSESVDFFNQKTFRCEDALAYLNDTIPMVTNPSIFTVISAHNSKVASNRQIALGEINAGYQGSVEAEADGSKSLDIINSKLIGEFGGVLRMRYPNGVPTLDWLANYPNQNGTEQTIEFGKNLLDFTRDWDMSEFSTYCYVRGAEIEDSDPKAYYYSGWQHLEGQGGNPSPSELYGRIEKYLDYSDIDSYQGCVDAALTYLSTQQFSEMTLELGAVDLSMLNPSIKPFELLECVRVSSWPHGMSNALFAIVGIEIPLDSPENTSYTLGDATVAYKRRVNKLTKKNKQAEQDFNDQLDAEHDFTEQGLSDTLDSAKDYADGEVADLKDYTDQQMGDLGESFQQVAEEIEAELTARTEGHVTIVKNANGKSDAIYISSDEDYNNSSWYWRWDANGLAYYNGGSLVTAITYQGKFKGDLIEANSILTSALHLYGELSVYEDVLSQYIGGYMGYGSGFDGTQTTYGIHMYTSSGGEMIVTNSGARMAFGGTEFYLNGAYAEANCTLYAVDFSATSDRNAKKNIEYNPEKYRALFDLLRPCSFEYKKKDDGIRHTGFIAQDIEEVLGDSGLSENDFGCMSKRTVVDPQTQEKRIEYSLGYNELISLCVDQIQMLKQKIKRLEEKMNG